MELPIRRGIHVDCGTMRPKWLRKRQNSIRLLFSFTIEVPFKEHSRASTEIHDMVHELAGTWSHQCYRRLRREDDEKQQTFNNERRTNND